MRRLCLRSPHQLLGEPGAWLGVKGARTEAASFALDRKTRPSTLHRIIQNACPRTLHPRRGEPGWVLGCWGMLGGVQVLEVGGEGVGIGVQGLDARRWDYVCATECEGGVCTARSPAGENLVYGRGFRGLGARTF